MPTIKAARATTGKLVRDGSDVAFPVGTAIGGTVSMMSGALCSIKLAGDMERFRLKNRDEIILTYADWSTAPSPSPKPPTSRVLDHVPQPDISTCQSAAIARVIGTSDVMKVRRELLALGTAGHPAVMGLYMKDRVTKYKYNDNASLNDAIKDLKDGWQLITHGMFTDSGHVIGLSGWNDKNKTFNAEDPWAQFDFPSWYYSDISASGDDIPYSALGVYAACVVAFTVNQAIAAYNAGKIDFERKGMYLHSIQN